MFLWKSEFFLCPVSLLANIIETGAWKQHDDREGKKYAAPELNMQRIKDKRYAKT